MNLITQLTIFVLILALLKFAFGMPISIVGSVGLTLLLTGVFTLISRIRGEG